MVITLSLVDDMSKLAQVIWLRHQAIINANIDKFMTPYGSGHETAAVLLPGFAISW